MLCDIIRRQSLARNETRKPNMPAFAVLVLLITFAFTVNLLLANGHIMEIILDGEEPPLQHTATTSSASDKSANNNGNGGPMRQCRIEYQVTRQLVGWCTRLGRTSMVRACATTGHMVPFHRDCIL